MLRLLVRSGHEVMGVLAHAFSGLHAKSSIDFPDVPALGALVEDCLSFVGASHLPQACVCVCVCVCVVYVFVRACLHFHLLLGLLFGLCQQRALARLDTSPQQVKIDGSWARAEGWVEKKTCKVEYLASL